MNIRTATRRAIADAGIAKELFGVPTYELKNIGEDGVLVVINQGLKGAFVNLSWQLPEALAKSGLVIESQNKACIEIRKAGN